MLPTTTTSACKDGATSSAEASLSESDIGRAPAISSEDVEMSEPDAEEELEDPQLVAEYSSDIYSHLDRTETSRMPRPDYMESQPEINSKMRAILVDWLVEIHFKFKYKLKMETLFLCVNIVDRYLGLKTVTLLKLQLVGVAGMMIAAKFEEIHPPETKDYVYITDGAFTKEEVMQTEVEMLQALGFDLCAPTVPQYLERYQRAANCSEEHGYLLQYLLELSLLDYKLVRYQPSYLVAAAAFVSNMLLRVRQSWPSSVVKHTSEAEEDIRECASKMWNRFEGASTSPVQAVRWKYSHARFGGVSKKTF
jgi:cyclin B